MNAKQTVPLIATLAPLAPLLLIGGGIFLLLKCLSSTEDKEKKSETAPADTETEIRRKVAETTAFRQIPAEISVKPAAVPAAVAIPKIVPQAPPLPPIKKKFVTREDMATVFHHSARPLTRTAAVAALKNLGFGKTAAYDALLENGHFATWLQFAPDGIITWKN
jgi:hypothetical protein